jgi:hypothetical protein
VRGDTSGSDLLRLGSRIPKQGGASFAASKLGAFPSAHGAANSYFPSLRRDLEKTARSQTPVDSIAGMEALQLISCEARTSLLQFCGCQPHLRGLYAEAVSVH